VTASRRTSPKPASGFGAFVYEGRAKTELARLDGHPYPDELQAAFKAFDDQDYTAAASKAKPSAKKGVAGAQFLLGELAYREKDYDAAVSTTPRCSWSSTSSSTSTITSRAPA
jgi:hypothetical protein